MENELQFKWERQPAAEKCLSDLLTLYREKNGKIRQFEEDLQKHTSTRLFDWIDYFAVVDQSAVKCFEEVGFELQAEGVYYHPGAQLPRIAVMQKEGVAVKVEQCADFLMVHGISSNIEGIPYGRFRRALVEKENDCFLWVVERRCYPEVEPEEAEKNGTEKYLKALEIWKTRERAADDEEEGMQNAFDAVKQMIALIGRDLAAWAVMEGERAYWQARNHAGQVQKNRQDRLGMGWANHDHHTFRSSRKFFPQLIRLFELLGFHCRERFYAGEEAGWGAQVMENPGAGLVLFCDLDLSPEELHIDFAHEKLSELPELGTIGLWCALHGDSILKAGMHHLEAQFSFEELTNDLHQQGVGMMDPFSNFSYLKQAFTHGEQWVIDPKRLDKLLVEGKISSEEKEKFLKFGAVGSHMENLQRREGYKGFNQKNVSYIIKETDPRVR
ncbi:hypothetical protein [Waddlia chondrophila]|uniref:Uncharacterized protein n=2 Tax=Waddlia chondrophila TaxID=71667 RepID=D6YVN0_WADCW|nr:hypothetical protein [Waddlia chondrophila]ADI38191.1 conserved hypothetical protein [Waddlia chondrophila WSU 86-1044]